MSLLEVRSPAVEPDDHPRDGDVVDRALAVLAAVALRGGDGSPASVGELRAWVDAQSDLEGALGHLVIRAGAGLAWARLRTLAPSGPAERAPRPPEPASEPKRDPALADDPEPGAARPRPTPPTPAGVAHRARAIELQPIGQPRPVRPVTDPPQLGPRQQRQARRALWVEYVGVIVLLFVPYQLWGTAFEQAHAQANYRAGYTKAAPSSSMDGPTLSGSPAAPGSDKGTGHVPVLPGGSVARLEIPAIHLDQFVVEGTGESDLRKGPGHYPGSSLPGQHGNAAVAGHRTTYGAPFSRLDELKLGDTIIATTPRGRFLYAVSGHLVVSPNQASVVDDYGDDRLTLTTCTPKFLATHRLVVFAKLEGPAPETPAIRVAAPPSPSLRPLSTNGAAVRHLRAAGQGGFDFSALPLATFGTLLVLGLAFGYRPLRRQLPPVATMAVLAPMWLGALLFLFEQLNRFLPANV